MQCSVRHQRKTGNLDAKALGLLSVGEGILTWKDRDDSSQGENNSVLQASERAQVVEQCLGVKESTVNNSWWIAVVQQLIVI